MRLGGNPSRQACCYEGVLKPETLLRHVRPAGLSSGRQPRSLVMFQLGVKSREGVRVSSEFRRAVSDNLTHAYAAHASGRTA
eukprot:294957-Chlamydomonas_euryale.AAC.2